MKKQLPYSPEGNYCSICNVYDQWCAHIRPPKPRAKLRWSCSVPSGAIYAVIEGYEWTWEQIKMGCGLIGRPSILNVLLLVLGTGTSGAVAHAKVSCQTATTSCTLQASNTNDAVVLFLVCSSTNTPSAASISASGWTFTNLGSIGGTAATGWIRIVGAIAPNTTSVTATSSWTVTGGCSFTSIVGDEWSGNDTTGGTTTFDATGTLFATSSSGSCSFATVKPSNNNDGLEGMCSPATSTTAVGSGFTKGADDSSGDWTEYKVLSGGSGSGQTINFTSSGGWTAAGMTIKPAAAGGTQKGYPVVE